ncbi:hypothetical protein, partial [Roseovarius sp. D22-M7]|uniref:hypothetical protein n=1 Tax=Roseovarius sp. D22-M7 TaxID=3127116 RepID=UPI00300FF465
PAIRKTGSTNSSLGTSRRQAEKPVGPSWRLRSTPSGSTISTKIRMSVSTDFAMNKTDRRGEM